MAVWGASRIARLGVGDRQGEERGEGHPGQPLETVKNKNNKNKS